MRRRPAPLAVVTAAVIVCAAVLTAAERSAGSGGPAGQAQIAAGQARVWPSPPAPARIKFVGTLSAASSGRRSSFLGRLWDVVSGGPPAPRMTRPYGVAVDQAGRVFVADTAEQVVHVFEPGSGDYSSIAVSAASLIGVAVTANRLYVTDADGARLICTDFRGREIWTVEASDGLRRPTGITAVGGRLYVVDSWSHQVLIVDATGRIDGAFGSHGVEPGEFNFPTNIAAGPDGRLYVTDTLNFRIQIFDSSGRHLGSFGTLGDGSGEMHRPKGIALDSDGHIYVVEGYHDVVQIFDDAGRFLLAFAEPGQGDGQLWLATGIAIGEDRIYVSDSANERIQMYEYLKVRQ